MFGNLSLLPHTKLKGVSCDSTNIRDLDLKVTSGGVEPRTTMDTDLTRKGKRKLFIVDKSFSWDRGWWRVKLNYG